MGLASILGNFGVSHALKPRSRWLIKPLPFTGASVLRFFDHLFNGMGPKTDPHCKLNDAQIATIAIMAVISFYGNQAAACGYMQRRYKMNVVD